MAALVRAGKVRYIEASDFGRLATDERRSAPRKVPAHVEPATSSHVSLGAPPDHGCSHGLRENGDSKEMTGSGTVCQVHLMTQGWSSRDVVRGSRTQRSVVLAAIIAVASSKAASSSFRASAYAPKRRASRRASSLSPLRNRDQGRLHSPGPTRRDGPGPGSGERDRRGGDCLRRRAPAQPLSGLHGLDLAAESLPRESAPHCGSVAVPRRSVTKRSPAHKCLLMGFHRNVALVRRS
jgi:hypothetical protein